ncbi:MAG: 50S ribosomal protein L25/general stress protein Ctc [Caulobacteraceae bacterium]|jgi:large subunit ribosomal protein L25|nr:50S ribosomal protein L25/general stress protein Ctc [Caulobacteraceae bacterium]MBK8542702.1 50S ribosomal protein L25/general stress protein Ctc [Caulobacteraceae bacterium]MBP6689372.1 50S ribosomal protein L25/general stress protein Ctc [Hyphomonadaceae bacterium]
MAGIVLNVDVREKTGTGGARATRNSGLIPGVLYGGKRGAIPIQINAKDVELAIRSGKFLSHMVELNHQGEKQPVIPRAIQFHPVSDKPIHVDLYRVEENAEIAIDVVVHFKNHEASPGLKRGGALNVVRHTIKLKCKANKIPEEIVIDLTGRDIGDSVHISQITLPDGARPVIRDRDFTIATIVGRKVEEEVVATPTEAAPAAAAGAADAKKDEKK